LTGGADESSVLVVDKSVTAGEDPEGRECLEARRGGVQARPALSEDSGYSPIEARVGTVEAAVRSGEMKGRLLAAQAVGEVAEPVGVQAMPTMNGAVEAQV
jgi:hypothetical protein